MPSSTPTSHAGQPEQRRSGTPVRPERPQGHRHVLEVVLADGDGGKIKRRAPERPTRDECGKRVAVGTRPQAIARGCRDMRTDCLEDLRDRALRSRDPQLLHESRRLTVPTHGPENRVRIRPRCRRPIPASRSLGGPYSRGAFAGLVAIQVWTASRPRQLNARAAHTETIASGASARRGCEAGARPVRGTPVLSEPYRATRQGEHRPDQEHGQQKKNFPELAHRLSHDPSRGPGFGTLFFARHRPEPSRAGGQ